MSQELLYTSAPKGLKAGTHGFCMVLCSEGMPAPLATALEGLSAYKPVYPVGDPAERKNPVTAMHVILPAIGRKQHVLSRVASYGLDYSGRPNKLAHHVVLEARDKAPAGPAWMLQQPSVMKRDWSGEPRVAPANRKLPAGDVQPAACRAWAKATGDAGWAGVLAESLLKDPTRLAYLIIEPGFDPLPLFAEAIALLPPDRRWQATFSTYFTTLPAGAICNWRCLLADSPLVHQSKRQVHALRLDLTSRLGKAPDGEWVEFARTGVRPRVAVASRPAAAAIAAETVDDIGDAYDLVAVPRSVAGPPIARQGRQHKRGLVKTVTAVVTVTVLAAAGIWASLYLRRPAPIVIAQGDIQPEDEAATNGTAENLEIDSENSPVLLEERATSGERAPKVDEASEHEEREPLTASPRSAELKDTQKPLEAGTASPRQKTPKQQYFVASLPKQQGLEPKPLTATFPIEAFNTESTRLHFFAGNGAADRIGVVSEMSDPRRLVIGYAPAATQDPIPFAAIDVPETNGTVKHLILEVQSEFVDKVSVLDRCALLLTNVVGDELVVLFRMTAADQRPDNAKEVEKLSDTISWPKQWRFEPRTGRRMIRVGLPFSENDVSSSPIDILVKELSLKVGDQLIEFIQTNRKSVDEGETLREPLHQWTLLFEAAESEGFLKGCETITSITAVAEGSLSMTSLLPRVQVDLRPDEMVFQVDSKRLRKAFTDQANANLKALSSGQSTVANGALVLTAAGRDAASNKLTMLREQLTSMSLPGSGVPPARIQAVKAAILVGERLLIDGALVQEAIDQFENAEIAALQGILQLKSLSDPSASIEIPLVTRVFEGSSDAKE